MKRFFPDNVKAFLLLVLIILLTKMIPVFPWWTFVIPVTILGLFISGMKWKVTTFTVGFLAGFCVWTLTNLYFGIPTSHIIFGKLGLLLGVHMSVVFLLAGVIGGILTGLALYTGKSFLAAEPAEVSL